MKYDNSISNKVPLFKILDEMILDSTDISVIVQFLKSHGNAIEDIYRHSAFAFDLYDIATNPGLQGIPFLVDHMHQLPETSMTYAALCSVAYYHSNSCGIDVISKIYSTCGKKFSGSPNYQSRYYLSGNEYDFDVINGKTTLRDVISKICQDQRDVSHFMRCSYLVKSAFMMGNFLQFYPSEQYILVNTIVKQFEMVPFFYGKDNSMRYRYCVLIVSLLKQLLYQNQTDMFNWIVSIINGYQSKIILKDYVKVILGENIPDNLNKMLLNKTSFEEIVFEMNMYETQFDSLDLFILMYLCFSYSHSSMIDNKELFEFFNLPFELGKLTLFEGMNNGSRRE